MTHAIVYRRLGGPEVLEWSEVSSAAPGDGEVSIRVEAAGVNPIDAKLRAGVRPSPPIERPRRVGADGAGTILAVGPGVEGLRVGMPVVVASGHGMYAETALVDARTVVPLPHRVGVAEGAAIGIPAATAYQALRSLAVDRGDTLLVHGGSGAVGQAVIQFAVLAGARVIATTSDRRAPRVRELGALALRYGDGLPARVREVARGEVTVALDCAGTDEALQASVELVSERTRVATLVRGADAAAYGIQAYAGGAPHPLTERQRQWRAEAIPLVLGLMAAGRFSVELGPAYHLRDAALAHRDVERGTDGKIVLRPDQP